MAEPPRGSQSNAREDARAVALAEELGAQLDRLKGAGPKLMQFLSMIRLDRGRPTATGLVRCPTARKRSPSAASDA